MAIQAGVVLLRNKIWPGWSADVLLREDICRVAECRQRLSIRLIVMGSVANGHAWGKACTHVLTALTPPFAGHRSRRPFASAHSMISTSIDP